MSVGALLPNNTGVFEFAGAEGMSDALPVPIRQIMDPATTPAAFLPYLAAHRGVDLWYGDWSLSRKRQMVTQAVSLAAMKGTRAGAIAFLGFVDATLSDAIAYPTPFALGFAFIGRTPIAHPKFTADYLVETQTRAEPGSFCFGQFGAGGAIGVAHISRPSDEPLHRALAALNVNFDGKSGATMIRVDFQHHRVIRVGDGIEVGDGYVVGQYVPRTHF
jgi:P2-related tail formation protein